MRSVDFGESSICFVCQRDFGVSLRAKFPMTPKQAQWFWTIIGQEQHSSLFSGDIPIWKLIEFRMLDDSHRTRAGISILTSAMTWVLQMFCILNTYQNIPQWRDAFEFNPFCLVIAVIPWFSLIKKQESEIKVFNKSSPKLRIPRKNPPSAWSHFCPINQTKQT